MFNNQLFGGKKASMCRAHWCPLAYLLPIAGHQCDITVSSPFFLPSKVNIFNSCQPAFLLLTYVFPLRVIKGSNLLFPMQVHKIVGIYWSHFLSLVNSSSCLSFNGISWERSSLITQFKLGLTTVFFNFLAHIQVCNYIYVHSLIVYLFH